MPHDRRPNPKKRKLEIKFNDKARSEYLSGFRKRRQARQLKAMDEAAKKLKQKVREERNKKRKAAREKREEILKGVPGLFDNLNDDVSNPGNINETYTEKLDFQNHEVLVKSGFNFESAGFLGNNNFEPTGKQDVKSKKQQLTSPTNATQKSKLKSRKDKIAQLKQKKRKPKKKHKR